MLEDLVLKPALEFQMWAKAALISGQHPCRNPHPTQSSKMILTVTSPMVISLISMDSCKYVSKLIEVQTSGMLVCTCGLYFISDALTCRYKVGGNPERVSLLKWSIC